VSQFAPLVMMSAHYKLKSRSLSYRVHQVLVQCRPARGLQCTMLSRHRNCYELRRAYRILGRRMHYSMPDMHPTSNKTRPLCIWRQSRSRIVPADQTASPARSEYRAGIDSDARGSKRGSCRQQPMRSNLGRLCPKLARRHLWKYRDRLKSQGRSLSGRRGSM
jgi:hypothetical protein